MQRAFKIVLIAGAAGCLLLVLAATWGVPAYRARRTTAREHDIEAMLQDTAWRHGIDPALVRAVVRQESRFDPQARGAAGEIGLMQITVNAARDWERLNHRSFGVPGTLFDPALNLEVGTWYLARGLEQWQHHDESVVLALIQYNAGRRNALACARDCEKNLADQIQIPSTRGYISQVLAYRAEYRKPATGPGER